MAKGKSSHAASMLGGGDKKKSSSKSGKVHEMHIRRAHSGGFIVKHHHEPDPESGASAPSEEHVVGDVDQLQQHVADNMGDQPGAEEASAPAGAQDGAPGTGALPAAAGPAAPVSVGG
jgi:hypothetical protein